jgi:hypothetical protein
MQFSDEFLAKWEHIIGDVQATEVPLECIKKIIIRLAKKKQRTINLNTLRRQGLDIEQIETVISHTLQQLGDTVHDMDFVVDIGAVAEIVQPETDRLLEKLK